ncbi:MAG: hypothetical protein ACRDJH_20380 [Thermomicrobiales bacterium]
MAGRASVFSQSAIIRLASEHFVPVAENSSALERQQDDKGEFFRHVAEQGHYGGRTYPTRTRQGSYAFSADGRFLGAINSRDPEAKAGMMRTALARWSDGDGGAAPSPVQLADSEVESDGYPDDGLILMVAARDLPRAVDTRPDDWRRVAWNLDYAWFTRDEATALVPARVEVVGRRAAPASVCRRLGRFHLRDFVRGEPFAWPVAAIRHAELWSEVAAVDGAEIRLRLRGAIRLEHEAHWIRPEDGEERRYPSGYDAALNGEATWDTERGAFTTFDLLAAGPRWGANQYNNRDDDLGPAPLGIAVQLAGNTPADRTAPHCLRTWRVAGAGARPNRVAVEQAEYFR